MIKRKKYTTHKFISWHFCLVVPLLALLALLAGCYSEEYDAENVGMVDGKAHVVLTFVTPNDGSSTRAAANAPDGYEAGIDYENDIDISGGDYRIYFFSYESGDTKGGTLIAEFTADEVTSSASSSSTIYTMTGTLPVELWYVNDFRVVILANWGNYPSVTVGTTTIDDLCEGTNTTYSASNKFSLGQNSLIPFFGVQEYTGVTFISGTLTRLSTPVSLLRAVAKVEVILTADSDYDTFDNIAIENYNAQGYCAPAGVYLASDYDTKMNNNPSSSNWSDEWVADLHLVNNTNDTGNKTQAIPKISSTTSNTWRIYVPEYDNMGIDYSYISLTVDGEPYEIYFAEYDEDGFTDISTASRYNLKRNNLYRFYVTLKNRELRVFVETWENVFDNEWKFGEYSHLIYADDDINNFTDENGYIYASLVVEGEEDNPTVYLQKVSATTTGYVRIPETVTYLGYTYTVVGIGSYSFDADQDVTFIDIPETITYIGEEAFHGDIGLEGIAVHSDTPPTCAENAFDGDNLDTIILYVPTNAVETYSTTSPWSTFKNIVGIDFVQ